MRGHYWHASAPNLRSGADHQAAVGRCGLQNQQQRLLTADYIVALVITSH